MTMEFNEPIPKKFPPKSRFQPLPILYGDWSEMMIKGLWPCYVGILKSNSVIVNNKSDMESLYKAGYFGQSSLFDKKTFKCSENIVCNFSKKKRKKNWDQLIVSNSFPQVKNFSSSKNLKLNSGDSSSSPEIKTDKSSSSGNADIDVNTIKTEVKLNLSDSEEDEDNEEDVLMREVDLTNESDMNNKNESVTVENLDPFTDEGVVTHLSFEEVFFLAYGLGCLTVLSGMEEVLSYEQLFDIFSKTDPDFPYKYVTYHYYRAKGWVVRPGIKFGGDFLLYKQGPPFYHASFIVVIEKDSPMSWTTLTGLNRLAGSVNKDLLITKVSFPSTNTITDMLSASITETLIRRWVPTSEVTTGQN